MSDHLPTETYVDHLRTETNVDHLPTETNVDHLPTETNVDHLPTENTLSKSDIYSNLVYVHMHLLSNLCILMMSTLYKGPLHCTMYTGYVHCMLVRMYLCTKTKYVVI